MELQKTLDAYQEQARVKRPPEWQAIMDRATEALRQIVAVALAALD